ncbi:uncharacterized protein TNCV_1467892 [Trichonephila clavipes]|uniref:Uncharacterized protein n=1 Tax=Trichonephila clavipes TaxID=2585209 RepID=A0A8X6RZ17_TRICX|nr:uncharacterized protein TNCV_1467892 [Trichonephila clavipes]
MKTERCLSNKAAYNWLKKFPQGRFKIVDEDRSGRPVLIATKSTEQQVEGLILADRRVTINSIATAIGCFHGLACSLMHDRLNFQKVCKQHLGGKQFADDDDVEHKDLQRMKQKPKEFYAAKIGTMIKR